MGVASGTVPGEAAVPTSADHAAAAPSPWVERFASLVPRGAPVLDLAAGGGRHARFFRDRGHAVTAVDRDVSALALVDGIEVVAADLEGEGGWPLPGRRFGGIVVVRYLHRPLLPLLAAHLAPGGALLYETFARGHERFGRPRNPAFLLERGELLVFARAAGLGLVAWQHAEEPPPRPAVVQRLAAVRPV